MQSTTFSYAPIPASHGFERHLYKKTKTISPLKIFNDLLLYLGREVKERGSIYKEQNKTKQRGGGTFSYGKFQTHISDKGLIASICKELL